VFPEIKPQLINIFERYRHVLDSELQQRACEFYALASRPDDDELLQNVCEEIPPFPPRESALLSRLNKKLGATEDKRTWVHGGRDLNHDREAAKVNRSATTVKPTNGSVAAAGTGVSDVMTSLHGLDLSGPSSVTSPTSPPTVLANPAIAPHLAVGASVDRRFEKLIYTNEGVLYEDVQIQVGIKSRYQGHIGQLAIYMGNKISAPFTSFTTKIDRGRSGGLVCHFCQDACYSGCFTFPITANPSCRMQEGFHNATYYNNLFPCRLASNYRVTPASCPYEVHRTSNLRR